MSEVARLQPKDVSADLDQIAREGARRMLAEALESEADPATRAVGYVAGVACVRPRATAPS